MAPSKVPSSGPLGLPSNPRVSSDVENTNNFSSESSSEEKKHEGPIVDISELEENKKRRDNPGKSSSPPAANTTPPPPTLSQSSSSAGDLDLNIPVIYRGTTHDIKVPPGFTIQEFASLLADSIESDIHAIKLWIRPRPGLLKFPFPETLLGDVFTSATKVQLIGSPAGEVKMLNEEIIQGKKLRARLRGGAGNTKTTTVSKSRDWKKVQDESKYTFHTIQPLEYLPNPEKSKRFLERLANDPGIKASMRKHEFSVGLLTEMNPAEHTTQESRTLGLNRNRGEVIELRLRTDRYDGYRDYKVIRKTLCHELSHNVWGDHDANFWSLTKQIEKEVEQNDWKHGGHALTNSEFYNPGDEMDEDEYEYADHGGWTGGEFVLGSSSSADTTGLSRREIMARAAQSRLEKQQEAKKGQDRNSQSE